MNSARPHVIVIGGPNGAGKTTIAREVLEKTLGITEFVNADAIAAGLSGFEPERAAFAAGRVMLTRLRELAAARASFAFETTLASRTFAPWLAGLMDQGFEIHVLYVWVLSPELAIKRVKARVRKGGHAIPENVIRRRHGRSAANFMRLYKPLAESSGTWSVYDNSARKPRLVARGGKGMAPTIVDVEGWARLRKTADG